MPGLSLSPAGCCSTGRRSPSTLVVTFLFGPYFVNGFIGDPALGATLWAYATGGAELIAALLAPILGSIADAGFPRKPWIAGFSVPLVVGLCGLWLAVPGQTGMAPLVLLSFALAIIGAELATVFNNAMMPSLVSHKRLGTLSGIGWAAGYVGGLVSLVLVAGFIIADPDTGKTLIGLNPVVPVDMATRADERLVGPFSALWYLIFVLPLFLFTPDRPGTRAPAPVKAGITQLISSAKGSAGTIAKSRSFSLPACSTPTGSARCSPLAAFTPRACSAGEHLSSACSESSLPSPAPSAPHPAACSTTGLARSA
jgi:MFS-type transporter involved in bile tolerance (Atg22 family)